MSDIFPVLPFWITIIELFEDKSKKYLNINKYKSKKYSNISTFRRNSFTCARSRLVDSCLVLPTPAWSTTTEGWYRWNVDELDDRDKMMMLMNMPAYSGLIYGCQVYQMLIYRGQAYQMIIYGGQVYQMFMLGRFTRWRQTLRSLSSSMGFSKNGRSWGTRRMQNRSSHNLSSFKKNNIIFKE